jgi:hypothetical protein
MVHAAPKTTEAAATEAAQAAFTAPSRLAHTPTRGYACEASMAGHRAALGLAYPQAQAGGQDPRADRPKAFTAQRSCRRR